MCNRITALKQGNSELMLSVYLIEKHLQDKKRWWRFVRYQMFIQDGIATILSLLKDWIKDLTLYPASNNTSFQDSLLVQNVVCLLESVKEITKLVRLESRRISYILPAIRSLPTFCFTEHAGISLHGVKAEMHVGICRFVMLKPIKFLHCYIFISKM